MLKNDIIRLIRIQTGINKRKKTSVARDQEKFGVSEFSRYRLGLERGDGRECPGAGTKFPRVVQGLSRA